MAVSRTAPSKINLYLHVLGRRADGYHLLDSLVVFADIADRLSARAADALSLEIVGPYAAALQSNKDDNLVLRAARLLAERAGVPAKAAIYLEKNLPVASGIGGGSSDAAAALTALAELWQLEPAAARFAELAPALGADVPVCLFGKNAWVGGIGESVAAAPPLPGAWIVLANPGAALSTAEVFRVRTGPFSEPARFAAAPANLRDLAALLGERRNDLTQAAMTLAPAIAQVLDALQREKDAVLARMSGSGATCFALFGDETSAREAARRIAAAHGGWWVAAGRLV